VRIDVTEAPSFHHNKAWASKAAPPNGMALFLCLRLRGAGRTRRPNDGSRLKLNHLNWMNEKPEFAKTKLSDQGLNEMFKYQEDADDVDDDDDEQDDK
jgi:hypothetical protein